MTKKLMIEVIHQGESTPDELVKAISYLLKENFATCCHQDCPMSFDHSITFIIGKREPVIDSPIPFDDLTKN